MSPAFKGIHLSIKAFREHLNVSQTAMASSLGIAQTTYAHYESKSDVRIPLEILQKLAKMGLNLHWLFTGEGSMVQGQSIQTTGNKIQPEHVEEAYIVMQHGLGKHKLPRASEGYVLGLLAEAVAEGKTPEEVQREFARLVEEAVAIRQRTRRPG